MLIYGLFLAPQFTPEMERGAAPPPYINHDTVDWLSLGQSLADYFEMQDHGVTLRVANDTVDQVTIHMREYGVIAGPIDCSDFAETLSRVAQATEKNPIPVQEHWHPLHQLKDRTHAPPPIMIPLVFEGDHVDIRELVYTMMLRLKVKAAQHPERLFSGESLPEDFYQGYLPESITDILASHFGVDYKIYATLAALNPDRPAF